MRPNLFSSPQLYVRQQKEWQEIVFDFETANRYEVLDGQKSHVLTVAERSGGILQTVKRWILGSHRPLQIDVYDQAGQHQLLLSRTFFWFFSDLFVTDAGGNQLGSVHRRFSVFYKNYDLVSSGGHIFAYVKAPRWRIWTFPVRDLEGNVMGEISKKWSGFLSEAFTDADTFLVDFGGNDWAQNQRALIFAAAISIDFDFFENNRSRSG